MTGRCDHPQETRWGPSRDPERTAAPENTWINWAAVAAAVPGEGHVERGLPCQDRASAWTSPRPCAIVLDGRGSAKRSHDGAEAAITALRRCLLELEPLLAECLDRDEPALARVSWMSIAQQLYCCAAREQRRLSNETGMQAVEFEFTLSLTVSGTSTSGWMSVGDSPVVVQSNGVLGLPHALAGGEFANQTHFVQARPGTRLHLYAGVLPSSGLEAVLVMSDGTASKFIDLQKQVPAQSNSQLADLLATGDLQTGNLTGMLRADHWRDVTRDDRSVAILVCRLKDRPASGDAADLDEPEADPTLDPGADVSPKAFLLFLLSLAFVLIAILGGNNTSAQSVTDRKLAVLPKSARHFFRPPSGRESADEGEGHGRA
jgi:hypothetical protein